MSEYRPTSLASPLLLEHWPCHRPEDWGQYTFYPEVLLHSPIQAQVPEIRVQSEMAVNTLSNNIMKTFATLLLLISAVAVRSQQVIPMDSYLATNRIITDNAVKAHVEWEPDVVTNAPAAIPHSETALGSG